MAHTIAFKPAEPQSTFDDMPIVLSAIADTCLQDRKGIILQTEHRWFCDFADWRVRWLYRNDKKWNRELKKDDPRDFLYTWIGHWADAFIKDPTGYIAQMRLESDLASPDPEWQLGGPLA